MAVREEICERLLAVNRAFYQDFSEPFARTRSKPQPGFRKLAPFMPESLASVLDVGCGEGRFGRFVCRLRPGVRYVGVDFTGELLDHAGKALPRATFIERDVSRPGSLEGLGSFDLVVALAVLQHIPGRENRVRLLGEMGKCLAPGGRLFISAWQFMESVRQRRKLLPWMEVGLSERDVEQNDHLMSWRSGGSGARYVSYIDERELEALSRRASLHVIETFRSDGREGNLNLYAVLCHAGGARI